MRGKKGQHTDKRNTIIVNGQRIPVSPEVYEAYYQEYERARYLKNKEQDEEVYSLDRFVQEGVPVEYWHAMTETSFEERYVTRQILLTALDALDKVEREIIEKIFWEQLSETKTAERLGITRQAVNYRKRIILKKLKKRIKV